VVGEARCLGYPAVMNPASFAKCGKSLHSNPPGRMILPDSEPPAKRRPGAPPGIGATVGHKVLMMIEGLLGHLHEDVLGAMRGNVRVP